MPAEERRERVLEFMSEHDMPLPPLAIFGGMTRHGRITFSYRTVQNILKELVETGDVARIDTESLRDGEIEPLDDSGGRRRAYYIITDQGKERVSNAG